MRLILDLAKAKKIDLKDKSAGEDESYNNVPVGMVGADAFKDTPDEQEEEPVKKSFVGFDMAKSFRDLAREQTVLGKVSNIELRFLTQELGYTEDDITKGLASITGKDRHRFTEWLLSEAKTSVSSMVK